MRFLRFILFPAALLYGVVTWVRNKLFDLGLKKENKLPFPSICVGNLSAGGTGKTPHVLLLNKWLSEEFKVYIISRGYGRKTKGLLIASEYANAESIGDEPMLFHLAEPQPTVIVAEKRMEAVQWMEKENPGNPVVLLDDAFQHRHVKAGFNILLCDYNAPYFKDFMLPTGNLREFKSGEKRADIVIVTKCPSDLNSEQKAMFFKGIHKPSSDIFFSKIVYGAIEKWGNFELPNEIENLVLVTGIANPKPLENHLSKSFSLKSLIFPDHHDFTLKDVQHIHEIFGNFASEKTILLTTEKDAMRLDRFKKSGELSSFPWFIQKMTVEVENEMELKNKIKAYVRAV